MNNKPFRASAQTWSLTFARRPLGTGRLGAKPFGHVFVWAPFLVNREIWHKVKDTRVKRRPEIGRNHYSLVITFKIEEKKE